MIGYQVFINKKIEADEKCPIKENIGKLTPEEIIHNITYEFWKEWRRKLTKSPAPHIYSWGLGQFSLKHGPSKNYLRKLVKRLRDIRAKYGDDYKTEGTKAYGMYAYYNMRLSETWKQVDNLKLEVNEYKRRWRNKKIEKYGDKAIL